MTRILVVDDTEEDRYLLESLLKGYGYEVRSAGNGAEALTLARKDPPDLIITDMMMPVMDGFALCKEWKKDKKLKKIPLIFYTAVYTSSHDEEFAMSLGADRFIIKPQEPEELVAKLREVIQEQEAGKLVASPPILGEEMEFFRHHNVILFKKLETYVAQLKDASLYARSLIEVSLDPLVTISPDGKITDVNEATVQVTGSSRKELIGSDFSDYFTEPETARDGYQAVFSEGFVKDYPLAIRHKSGKVTDVIYNASVYKNEAGDVVGVFAAARDITQRKKAEEEIRKLNENLEQRVKERTAELEKNNRDLQIMIDGFVTQEQRIIEHKKKVFELEAKIMELKNHD